MVRTRSVVGIKSYEIIDRIDMICDLDTNVYAGAARVVLVVLP